MPFVWDGQHALNQGTVFGALQGRVAKERVNRRQTGIPAADGVMTFLFQMVKESADKGCVQVRQRQFGRSLFQPFLREGKNQAEHVAIAADGLRTGAPLRDEPFSEKSFHQSCKTIEFFHWEFPFE